MNVLKITQEKGAIKGDWEPVFLKIQCYQRREEMLQKLKKVIGVLEVANFVKHSKKIK